MNISYLIYQAERTRSAAEQREIDAQAGELAAAIAGLGRTGRRARLARRPARPAAVACSIPSPR